MKIPFNKASITDIEKEYVIKALDNDKICGDGYYTNLVNNFMQDNFQVKKALLTTSCTHALEMAIMLLKLNSEDEVLLPSYTFVSTANPILLAGAKPVFVDIDPYTMNIDASKITEKITDKTKAIIVVHYAGVSCDMDRIMEIARKHNLFVIEDAAQGVNAKYKGEYLGTIGDFGAYSFHETKNYVSGEGGALLINSNNNKYNTLAEIIREKGTDRSRFFRGEVDKYTWQDIGSSYLPSEVLAALLYAQFTRLDEIQSKRLKIWDLYYRELHQLEQEGKLRLPHIPEYSSHNAHMFYIILENEYIRNETMKKLKGKGVWAVFHYIPLHLSPVGEKLSYRKGDLPITENMSGRLLRLPLYADLSDEEVHYVINCVKAVLSE